MTRRPAPLEPGDQAHLAWGSMRWSVARQMRLAAAAAAASGAGLSGQYAALLAGADVQLTADQVRGLLPPARWPTDLAEHAVWLLAGDDDLRPVV